MNDETMRGPALHTMLDVSLASEYDHTRAERRPGRTLRSFWARKRP